jgi:hypothetical protein
MADWWINLILLTLLVMSAPITLPLVIRLVYLELGGRDREAAEAQKNLETQQSAWDRAYRDQALTCRICSELAPPIPRSGNRYRCDKCGNQFAGAKHNLPERPSSSPIRV